MRLVTLQDVRDYLSLDPDDEPDNDLLALLVDGLSQRVSDYTERLYLNPAPPAGEDLDPPSTQVKEYRGDESTVAIDDCRDVSLVELSASPDDADSWAAVDPDRYVLEPLDSPIKRAVRLLVEPPRQGVGWDPLAWRARAAGSISEPWPSQSRPESSFVGYLRVTARRGMAAVVPAVPGDPDADPPVAGVPEVRPVPDNVRLAVLIWVQNIHKRDQAHFSENIAQVIAAGVGMPKDVVDLLDAEARSTAQVSAV